MPEPEMLDVVWDGSWVPMSPSAQRWHPFPRDIATPRLDAEMLRQAQEAIRARNNELRRMFRG